MSDFDDTKENRGSWLRLSREIESNWNNTTKSYSYNKMISSSSSSNLYRSLGKKSDDFIDSFSGSSPFDPDLYGVSLPKEILYMALARSKRKYQKENS